MEKNEIRQKMPRQERAKQFASFDALKGLQNALRVKEYLHERTQKNEVSEEDADRISRVLINMEQGEEVFVEFFRDGHRHSAQGKAWLDIEKRTLNFSKLKVLLDELLDIKFVCQQQEKMQNSAEQ